MLASLAFAVAAAALAPAPVLTGPASEEGPARSARWLAWMQSARPNPNPPASRTSVYVRDLRTGRTRRVNPRGTYAATGGLDGSRLVLQLIRGGLSDIAVVDLPGRRLRLLPPSIDTRLWEWRPSLSGRWLLFGRIDYRSRTYATLLADLRTQHVVELDSVTGHGAYAAPGQVNGGFAVWMSCPDNVCNVYRYDIRRRTTLELPDPGRYRHWQFGPSVTSDGTVYFGRALLGCSQISLMRFRNGRVTRLLRLPEGVAFQYSYAFGRPGGAADVYFDRVGCERTSLSDVYRITTLTRSPSGAR
jgi:hypothetical protein